MISTSVFISEEMQKKIKDVATKTDRSQSQVIRIAIKQFLERENAKR